MKIFQWRKKEHLSKESPGSGNTWKDLMNSKGLDLWRLRDEAINGNAKGKEPFVELPLRKRGLLKRSSPPSVAVIICPHFFRALEEEKDAIFLSSRNTTSENKHNHHCWLHGFDKPTDSAPGCPQPLTRCTGKEWIRQRQQVTTAFQNLPARSLEAIQSVDIDAILQVATSGEMADYFGLSYLCRALCETVRVYPLL